MILKRLVDSINRSRFFSVLADETTDISCQEQLTLCARYVSDDFAIEESFLQFVPITDLSGKNLASTILNNLSDIGIDVSKMRGQGYDGATAMSGRLNGAQAYIREIIPTALYVHCAAHSLNLAVSNSCDLSPVRNCMGTIASVYNFFNAPKRQHFTQIYQHDFVNNKSSKTCSNLCYQMGRSTRECQCLFKFTICCCRSSDRNFNMARQRNFITSSTVAIDN